jgi:hypothetical protein
MNTYQSRHQPRRQMTVSGKIHNPALYDRFYDIAYDAMLRGHFPSMTLPAGKLVLRVVNSALTIEQARAIPPGSAMNGDNRFSGARLDGRHGQGALYVGTVGGILREHAHYSLQPPRNVEAAEAAAAAGHAGRHGPHRHLHGGAGGGGEAAVAEAVSPVQAEAPAAICGPAPDRAGAPVSSPARQR